MMTKRDIKKLAALARWHNSQAAAIRKIKRRSPWTERQAQWRASTHRHAANFLTRIVSNIEAVS